jgi:hypothetical protein
MNDALVSIRRRTSPDPRKRPEIDSFERERAAS